MNYIKDLFYKEQPAQNKEEIIEIQPNGLVDKAIKYYLIIRESDEAQKKIIAVSESCFDVLSVYLYPYTSMCGAGLSMINTQVTRISCQSFESAMSSTLKKVPFEVKIVVIAAGGVASWYYFPVISIIAQVYALKVGAEFALHNLNINKESIDQELEVNKKD